MLLYLECRFSNSITTSSCDCNKILVGEKNKTADTIPNSHANHKHLPEEFEKEEMKARKENSSLHIDNYSFYSILAPHDFVTDIFHPPLT
jgi:hypothetical protein